MYVHYVVILAISYKAYHKTSSDVLLNSLEFISRHQPRLETNFLTVIFSFSKSLLAKTHTVVSTSITLILKRETAREPPPVHDASEVKVNVV